MFDVHQTLEIYAKWLRTPLQNQYAPIKPKEYALRRVAVSQDVWGVSNTGRILKAFGAYVCVLIRITVPMLPDLTPLPQQLPQLHLIQSRIHRLQPQLRQQHLKRLNRIPLQQALDRNPTGTGAGLILLRHLLFLLRHKRV